MLTSLPRAVYHASQHATCVTYRVGCIYRGVFAPSRQGLAVKYSSDDDATRCQIVPLAVKASGEPYHKPRGRGEVVYSFFCIQFVGDLCEKHPSLVTPPPPLMPHCYFWASEILNFPTCRCCSCTYCSQCPMVMEGLRMNGTPSPTPPRGNFLILDTKRSNRRWRSACSERGAEKRAERRRRDCGRQSCGGSEPPSSLRKRTLSLALAVNPHYHPPAGKRGGVRVVMTAHAVGSSCLTIFNRIPMTSETIFLRPWLPFIPEASRHHSWR